MWVANLPKRGLGERRRSGSLLGCPPHALTSSGRPVKPLVQWPQRPRSGLPGRHKVRVTPRSCRKQVIVSGPTHLHGRWEWNGNGIALEMEWEWNDMVVSLAWPRPTQPPLQGQVWQARSSGSCGRRLDRASKRAPASATPPEIALVNVKQRDPQQQGWCAQGREACAALQNPAQMPPATAHTTAGPSRRVARPAHWGWAVGRPVPRSKRAVTFWLCAGTLAARRSHRGCCLDTLSHLLKAIGKARGTRTHTAR